MWTDCSPIRQPGTNLTPTIWRWLPQSNSHHSDVETWGCYTQSNLTQSNLVGGAITILKNMKANGKDDIPYIMEHKTCLKPPTRNLIQSNPIQSNLSILCIQVIRIIFHCATIKFMVKSILNPCKQIPIMSSIFFMVQSKIDGENPMFFIFSMLNWLLNPNFLWFTPPDLLVEPPPPGACARFTAAAALTPLSLKPSTAVLAANLAGWISPRNGHSMGFQRDFNGISMGFQWDFNGI